MQIVAPLLLLYALAMVCFTAPDGYAVWVQREQIVSVSRPHECAAPANAKVSVSNGQFFCVREGVAEALKKIDATK